MMKKGILLLFLLLFATADGYCQDEDIIKKFLKTEFNTSCSIKEIPKSFKKIYYKLEKHYRGRKLAKKFTIANPGEVFNEFDFGSGKIPWRRLIVQSKGLKDDMYFICFEKGGIVLQRYLYIIDKMNSKSPQFLGLSMEDSLATYTQIKKAVLAKAYRVMR